jgi:hypothetical protein
MQRRSPNFLWLEMKPSFGLKPHTPESPVPGLATDLYMPNKELWQRAEKGDLLHSLDTLGEEAK